MTTPLPSAVPNQSAYQSPTSGMLTPGMPMPPSAAGISMLPGAQQLTSDQSVIAQTQMDATKDTLTHFEKMAALTTGMAATWQVISSALKETSDHVEASAKSTKDHLTQTASRLTHSGGRGAGGSPYHPGAHLPHAQGSGADAPVQGAGFMVSPASTGALGLHHRGITRMAGDEPDASVSGNSGGGDTPDGQQDGQVQGQSFQDDFAQMSSLSNIRQAAAGGLLTRLTARASARQPYSKDDDGNWYKEDAGGNRFMVSSAEGEAFARQTNRIGRAQGVLSSVQQGSGIGSALVGVTEKAGIIGAGITAAKFGIDQAVDQRAKNAQFQQIYGGSNLSTGFSNRAEEDLFKWRNMFSMGDKQAGELFMGVSQLGLQGDDRQNALNFATGEYKNQGMDASQSIALISQSIRDGVSSFGELKTAIDQVSDSAKSGGLNISQVTQQYAQNYATVSQTLSGPQASTIAGGLTSAVAAQGATMEGVSLASLTSDTTMRIMAAQQGLSYGQFVAASQTNPAVFGQAAQGLLNSRLSDILSPQARMDLQSKAHTLEAATGGRLSTGSVQQLSNYLLESGSVDPDQVQQVMQSITGGTMSEGQAMEFLVRSSTGGINLGKEFTNIATQQQVHKVSGGTGVENMAKIAASKYGAKVGSVINDVNGRNVTTPSSFIASTHKGGSSTDAQAYYDFVKKTGTEVPEIESLLKTNDRNRRYVVQTASGPKQVGLDTAIKYYPDQLASGTAVIDSGSGKGDTVAQLTGEADPNVTSGQLGLKKPSSLQKASPGTKAVKNNNGGAGSVAIYPSAQLQQILNFAASGGAFIGTAQSTGMPAPAFPETTDLPSATGTP